MSREKDSAGVARWLLPPVGGESFDNTHGPLTARATLAAAREGEVGASHEIEVIAPDSSGVPVPKITRLHAEER